MPPLTYLIEATGPLAGRCRGEDGAGHAIDFSGSLSAPGADFLFMAYGGEILRRAVTLMKPGEPAVRIDVDMVTERQVPVVYCYREGATRLPVVFFNHGTTGSAIEQLFMGIPLAQAGFFVVMIDAWYHGRRKPGDYIERFCARNYKETYIRMLLGTCDDISGMIDHLGADERCDTTRVGISGISQGGFVSLMAITRDKRIRAAAPMVGSPDLEGPFGWGLPLEQYPAETIALAREVSPLRNAARMPPTALLVQNGDQDTLVPVEGTRKLDAVLRELYREHPEKYRYVEYSGLGHDAAPMQQPAMAWLVEHLAAG